MRQPSPSHYGSWPRIFGFVLKEAESRLACSSCLYLQERGQGGPLFLDDTEKKFLGGGGGGGGGGGPYFMPTPKKNFCPPPPPPGRDGSATELCQLRVLIREETWEITLKFLSQALLSNALNKKNELKSVRLNKFSKNHTCNSFLNLIRASFCICCASFCTFFSRFERELFFMLHSSWWQYSLFEFWQILWHRSWYVTVFLFNGTNKQRSIHLNAKIKERDRLLTAAPVGPGSPQK